LSWIYGTFGGAMTPLCAGLTLEWIQSLIDFFGSGALAWLGKASWHREQSDEYASGEAFDYPQFDRLFEHAGDANS
jgi:hypothetical protein